MTRENYLNNKYDTLKINPRQAFCIVVQSSYIDVMEPWKGAQVVWKYNNCSLLIL